MLHVLKIKECFLERRRSGEKPFEIRLNDRDYQVGDRVIFKTLWKEKDRPAECIFDGDWMMDDTEYEIAYVLHFPEGLKEGYVAFTLKECTPPTIAIKPKK
jgi:hypothetical protein